MVNFSAAHPLALLFPGQGSQVVGMAKDFFESSDTVRRAFEEASDGSKLDLKKLCFEGPEETLKKTEITQPAILTASVAIFRALQERFSWNLSHCIFAGHSLGEYSALVASGRLSLNDAARVVKLRGQYMQGAVPEGQGAMVALLFPPKVSGLELANQIVQDVNQSTQEVLVVANFNSPDQIVLAGTSGAVEKAIQLAPTRGAKRALKLPVSAPFHSPLMRGAAERLAQCLGDTSFLKLQESRYLVANVDAQKHSLDRENDDVLRSRLVSQATGSVLWVQSVQTLIREGCTKGLEVGPGAVLAGLCRRITHDAKSVSVHSVNSTATSAEVEAFLKN
jgi:[acyl-carrier-protein] S-malonyltransferase